ncbi:MAG: tyrosine-type recombinase/integrase [Bacteroidetes bacterium]|nr:tyrosine-type recombinase/integrase [Bacteroidota bacterium]
MRFFLKDSSGKDSTIYGYVTINGKKVKFTTGEKCKTADWQKGELKQLSTTKEIRNRLAVLKADIDEFCNKSTDLTPNKLTAFVQAQIKGEKMDDIAYLVNQFLAEKSQTVTEATIAQVKAALANFIGFKKGLQLADINNSLGASFTASLKSSGLGESTVNKYLKNVKVFLNWLYQNDHTQVNYAKYFKFMKLSEQPIYALTLDELSLLENSEIDNKKLERIRDIFLFSCYTGLRHSDVKQVKRENVFEGQLILKQQKTRQYVSIPLMSEAQAILEKYNYSLQISNQKANAYLKDLFKALEMNRQILTSKGTKKLSDVISFHCGRKTFCTTALISGMQSDIVKQISGHKKDDVFQRYVAFAEQTKQNEMQKMSRSARHLKIG